MNEIQTFANEEFGTIRTLEIDGEPWFVGKDVAECLGYQSARASVNKKVEPEDRRVFQSFRNGNFETPHENAGKALSFQNGNLETPNRGLTIINESGFYSLVLSSKLPSAKKFKKWVTSEVLPSIRKHGLYAREELLDNPDFLLSVVMALKQERERRTVLEETLAVQKQQITEMKPKACYYDVILNCKDLVAVSVIAKDYGWSARRLNLYLNKKDIQYKQGGIWLLYQKYAEAGYTSTKTHTADGADGKQHVKVHTYWTQKGRLFIYELLKRDGITPLIEQGSVEDFS